MQKLYLSLLGEEEILSLIMSKTHSEICVVISGETRRSLFILISKKSIGLSLTVSVNPFVLDLYVIYSVLKVPKKR
jgi:hypothetical protein